MLSLPGVAWLLALFVVPFYAICAVAFGGRFLNFGAPVKQATQVAEALPPTADEVDSGGVDVALQRPKQPATAAQDR